MSEVEKKKAAIVTGASSGIGAAIAERLVQMGYEVYGIGRHFDESINLPEPIHEGVGLSGISHESISLSGTSHEAGSDPGISEKTYCESEAFHKIVNDNGLPEKFCGNSEAFHRIVCDLRDTAQLLKIVKGIMRKPEISLEVLVNNAGAAYYGLHEEQNPEKIMEMVRVNLEVPMVLTQQLLRTLKKNKGNVINISSVTAISSNPHGVAYGATKSGLLSFSRSLFDETRKYGVGVTAILPDMTETSLYRNADFEADTAMDAHLTPEDVADAVEYALTVREGTCVPEIILRPQLHRIRKK